MSHFSERDLERQRHAQGVTMETLYTVTYTDDGETKTYARHQIASWARSLAKTLTTLGRHDVRMHEDTPIMSMDELIAFCEQFPTSQSYRDFIAAEESPQ